MLNPVANVIFATGLIFNIMAKAVNDANFAEVLNSEIPVVVDFWATWCAPCRREMPYLKALEEKFKDAQIVFLGLSTDSDKTKWEAMVKTGELTGVQLYLGPQSAFQKAYQIDGIPRFILLDKEGKIIDNNMSRPSQDATAAALEALDGIR